MQAVRYHEHGGTEVLEVEEIAPPEADHGEVLLEVEAAAVNPVDTYFREGSYKPAGLPWIPGMDAAGLVTEVGEGVTEFSVGDRVFATGLGKDTPGTAAEYVTVPVDRLARLPPSVSPETGAAAALVSVTAWQTLFAACDLEPAETALIHGGSGGVGHVAIQLSATAGAQVTATASTGYHDRLRELGADHVFDYRRDDLAEAVEEAGRPDVILDHRADEYLGFDATVAAQGGRIGVIGNEDPSATLQSVPDWRNRGLSMHHVSAFNTPDVSSVLSRVATLLEDGTLEAVVARRYSLDGLDEAHRAVLKDSYLGKLVVLP
jgi:NADPH2:quinone reductase